MASRKRCYIKNQTANKFNQAFDNDFTIYDEKGTHNYEVKLTCPTYMTNNFIIEVLNDAGQKDGWIWRTGADYIAFVSIDNLYIVKARELRKEIERGLKNGTYGLREDCVIMKHYKLKQLTSYRCYKIPEVYRSKLVDTLKPHYREMYDNLHKYDW